MFDAVHGFSGFSVDDLSAAKDFYQNTLGLDVGDGGMGNLTVTLPGGAQVFIYPKPNHQPATFTILNFVVNDIDATVAALNAAGVATNIFDDPNLHTDDRGISRGKAAGYGPDIAWFKDPAGNVLSVLSD